MVVFPINRVFLSSFSALRELVKEERETRRRLEDELDKDNAKQLCRRHQWLLALLLVRVAFDVPPTTEARRIVVTQPIPKAGGSWTAFAVGGYFLQRGVFINGKRQQLAE